MKKLIYLFFGVALLSACNNTTIPAEEKTETSMDAPRSDYQYYGDSISDEGAIPVNRLFAEMKGKDSIAIKVEGTISESCKVKGCWMKMDIGEDQQMHVSFKDYGFFVPKNLNGETAILEGYAIIDTMDVDYLQHLARDAGKPEGEVAKITEPEVGVSYVATGVIIKGKS